MSLLLQDTLVISPSTVEHIEGEIADVNERVDLIEASSDCADVVGTKAELDAYDTSSLTDQAIIKVLQDESQNDAQTYYRYSKSSDSFTLIGELGPFYTKDESDALLSDKVDKTNTENQVYGTDANGAQTTYDKNSFGQVDDVKVDNVSIVTNKIANIDLTGKVDKTTGTYKIYGTGNTGAQTTYTLSYTDATGYTIAQRSSDGNIVVGTTPTQNTHAASKQYVDTADALKQNKPTITASTGATLSVTLADNTIFNNTNAGLTTLTITNPTNPALDFCCQVNFTSGSTPTTITASEIIWRGSNVTQSGFTPVANKRYAILFFYNGAAIIGLVQGA